jgi:hypothetical protein
VSTDDILKKALAARKEQQAKSWNARNRVERYRPPLPMKGPFVWKFYRHPPGVWVFVIADTRELVRSHPMYDPKEKVCKATMRDLNELAKRTIEASGGTLFEPPVRMRNKRNTHQAVRTEK